MKVRNCMKRKVIYSQANISIREATGIMTRNHIGTLPIVDDALHLIGIVNMQGLIRLTMPDFIHLIENVDFVHDFGAAENEKVDPAILDLPVTSVMDEVVAVEESAGLVRAIALLQEHNMSDLPVLDADNRLVGIASYVDIGVLLINTWASSV